VPALYRPPPRPSAVLFRISELTISTVELAAAQIPPPS